MREPASVLTRMLAVIAVIASSLTALVPLPAVGAPPTAPVRPAATGESAAANKALIVHVEQKGEMVIVDIDATVDAPASTVWDVLTDYAHMPSFMSALKSSVVRDKQGNKLEVEQSGEARQGFLHFAFHTVRQIEQIPRSEIRSHLIEGDFKSYDLVVKLVDQGATTVIHQHGEYVPNTWVPPGIGPAAIKSETEKGYGEIIAEIMKRRAGTH